MDEIKSLLPPGSEVAKWYGCTCSDDNHYHLIYIDCWRLFMIWRWTNYDDGAKWGDVSECKMHSRPLKVSEKIDSRYEFVPQVFVDLPYTMNYLEDATSPYGDE
jgi:hypothetical protein